MDLRDHETEGHSRRVTEMTLRLARAMGIGEADLVHVRRGALLHDIGKIGIPDAILLKPGRLTDEEFAIIRRHPEYAREMLAPIAFLRPALDIPYCHHEKWDGSGYPRGLKGDQIPSAARIFAAVDIWDALGSDRPYRKGLPREEVKEHIRSLAGTHLDPAVVEAFLRCLEDDEAEATAAAAGRRDLDPGPAGDSLGGRLARAYETVRRLESEKREMVRVNARLAELCDTDDLTGLANPGRFRRSLEKAFSLSVGEGQPLSLVVLEVDQFQSHIDAHGPRSGDGVLVAVASILGGLTRPHDLGARRDGGGFAVILPSTDAAAACADRRADASGDRGPPVAALAGDGELRGRDDHPRCAQRLRTGRDGGSRVVPLPAAGLRPGFSLRGAGPRPGGPRPRRETHRARRLRILRPPIGPRVGIPDRNESRRCTKVFGGTVVFCVLE